MNSWHSYPKVYTVGHPAIKELFNEPVLVQEKIDGSQFSFGKTPEGKFLVRSRGRVFPVEAPDNLFSTACERVLAVGDKLTPSYTYRGEFLKKPKHNSLVYDRVPLNNIILFDVSTDQHTYAPELLASEADRLGFEYVKSEAMNIRSHENLMGTMDLPSQLGGKREGIVFKNYKRFGVDGHVMMGKFVSEEFKEVHREEWKTSNPTQGDIIEQIKATYCTPARWMKSLQHLEEAGTLTHEPKDIAQLIKETKKDFAEECRDEIMHDLWKWCKERVLDQSIRGLPEWYKDLLARRQFNADD